MTSTIARGFHSYIIITTKTNFGYNRCGCPQIIVIAHITITSSCVVTCLIKASLSLRTLNNQASNLVLFLYTQIIINNLCILHLWYCITLSLHDCTKHYHGSHSKDNHL